MTPLSASLVHICKYIVYIKGSGKRRRQKKKKTQQLYASWKYCDNIKNKITIYACAKRFGEELFLKKDQ